MEIFTAGSRASLQPNPDYFTGKVWMDPIVDAEKPANIFAVRVSFEPAARTAWHTHPLGQTLHVISGLGLVGMRKGAPQFIRPGDTVWIPPGEEHWHGAAPTTGMVHLAMQEKLDGSGSDWLEKVNDADYGRKPNL